MTPEELEEWKTKQKTKAYEEYEKDATGVYSLDRYVAKLKAIDQIF